jgi:hypothetical protein
VLPIWTTLRPWNGCRGTFDASTAAAFHQREIRLDKGARSAIRIELAEHSLADPQDGNQLGEFVEDVINVDSRDSPILAGPQLKSRRAKFDKSAEDAPCRRVGIIAHFTVGLNFMREGAPGLKHAHQARARLTANNDESKPCEFRVEMPLLDSCRVFVAHDIEPAPESMPGSHVGDIHEYSVYRVSRRILQ